MPSIHTSVEIAAPPATVRAIFLDFEKIPTWHTSFIKTIEEYNPSPSADQNSQDGFKMQPGDKLHAVIGNKNMEFYPVLLTNNENEFKWQGKLWGLPGLFTGHHAFRFEESKENVGGTTFVHGEEFWGILTGVLKEGSKAHNDAVEGFEKFNRDLKVRCETSKTKL